MASEVAATSLIEELSEQGFRASLVSTFNCYFPFYEEVVLRRLVAAGCAHNVLVVDAGQCAEAFSSEELRPRRAGRDYTLIPARCGGVFHPKIFLRVGKAKGTLLVGSHNLTLSGFGLNDEVTNAFVVQGASARSGAVPFRQAITFLTSFVPRSVPDVLDALEGVKLGVPWLEGPMGLRDEGRYLLTSMSTGPDLWSQVLPHIPRNVSRAMICAPFFDAKLAFLRRLIADVQPREVVIGIDPQSVELDPGEAASLRGVRFVNIAGVPPVPKRREDAVPYFHAKLLWFSGSDGELLVTGSANASEPAFLSPPSARNAEAVVACRREGASAALGVEALWAAPDITAEDWALLQRRRAEAARGHGSRSTRILIATPTEDGFAVQEQLPVRAVLRAFADTGSLLGDAAVGDGGTSIEAAEIIRAEAFYMQGPGETRDALVLVHRTEDIAQNLGGDTRKALRQALGALEEDPSQLETLLKLTEKVIFDSDDIIRSSPLRTAEPDDAALGPPVPSADSLALDASGRKGVRRKKSLASGDIVVLLDALIRRLGEGIGDVAAPRPQKNEEANIDADEEDGGDLAQSPPDHEALAKACRGKARRLIVTGHSDPEETGAEFGGREVRRGAGIAVGGGAGVTKR